VPSMLVLARPLHANRPSDSARNDGGIGCCILMPVHAVAAGTLKIDETHLFPWQTEESGKACAIAMRALRRSPNRRAIRAHIGHRAGGAEGGGALHRPEVTSGNRLCTLREGRIRCSLVDQDFVSDVGSAAQRGHKRVLFG